MGDAIFETPLGQSVLGVIIAVLLGAICWTSRWYFLNIVKPHADQTLRIQNQTFESNRKVQDRIAAATEMAGQGIVSINHSLQIHEKNIEEIRKTQERHGKTLDDIHRRIEGASGPRTN